MKKLVSIILCLVLVFSATSVFASAPRGGGLITDGESMIWVDAFNKQILRVTGEKTEVIAGKVGPTGLDGEPIGIYKDGTNAEAGFAQPYDAALFMGGIAVSDRDSNTIRLIKDGSVKTLIPESGGLKMPAGLAVKDNVLYIADTGNNRIVTIDEKGSVKVFADGIGSPMGIAFDRDVLYACATDFNQIYKVEKGKVALFCGKAIKDDDEYIGGYVNGPLALAEFDHPQGIFIKDGVIYVADTGNKAVRVIKNGKVSTVVDDTDAGYLLSIPVDATIMGDKIYVSDYLNNALESFAADVKFSDVNADQLAVVNNAVYYRLIKGFGDGTLKPTNNLTRAEFVTMLSRVGLFMDGQIVINGDHTFPDVAETDWFDKQIGWAVAQGLMKGSLRNDGSIIADANSYLKASEVYFFATRYAEQLNVSAKAFDSFKDQSRYVTRYEAISALVTLLSEAGY